MIVIFWIAAAFCAAVAAGFAYQQIGQRLDVRRWPPPGRIVNPGDGRGIHVYAVGEGSPTVVFESGISATSLNWRLLQTMVAPHARAVAYDRTGLGWSDAAASPCTPSNLASELHHVLAAAGEKPPFLLVGHSFGGLIVRRFAQLYPEETAGLVLVDPLAPEEWCPLSDRHRRMLSIGTRLARRGALLAHLGIVRLAVRLFMAGSRRLPKAIGRCTSGQGAHVINRLAGEVSKMPREVWPMVAMHWSNPKSFLAMAAHFESLPASAAEMRGTSVPGVIPVTVLTAGRNGTAPGESIQAIAPHARHVVAGESGHWIHLDQPRLVVEEALALAKKM